MLYLVVGFPSTPGVHCLCECLRVDCECCCSFSAVMELGSQVFRRRGGRRGGREIAIVQGEVRGIQLLALKKEKEQEPEKESRNSQAAEKGSGVIALHELVLSFLSQRGSVSQGDHLFGLWIGLTVVTVGASNTEENRKL
ncbi:hypothetical protein H920_10818 [Fukomys damarensis]|uniref:Uncharacterized protein n=1 Tax=Fukomys damarensis TaxID=885580 RepID=A0A091DBF2_FUKDA|nr:hypothetical protein H920_10818 [Fukomys damarensis]